MDDKMMTKRPKQVFNLFDTIGKTVITSKVAVDGCLATHSGHFHCDEALALAMLKVLPENRDRSILRTRDAELLSRAHLVCDVGAVYDPAKLRYDHHQRGFMETLRADKPIKLSSAGLIYKHYGKQIIAELLSDDPTVQEAEVNVLFDKCYNDFIEHIDGIDNGIEPYDGGKKQYYVSTSLSARVAHLNPEWNEENADENQRFMEAMKLTGEEFVETVVRIAKRWLPARKLVEEAVSKRFLVHPSGSIIKFEKGCPYKGHLSDIEDEQNIKIIYVLCADGTTSWRVQCVNDRNVEFVSRKFLPEKYRGLRDAELAKVSGIPDAIFIHAAGFTGGAKSYEGALKMAVDSLSL